MSQQKRVRPQEGVCAVRAARARGAESGALGDAPRLPPVTGVALRRQSVENPDVLAIEKFLSAFDVRVEAFRICAIRRGWRLAVAPTDQLALYYVLAGQGTIRISDGDPAVIGPSTVILVPPGHQQEIAAPHPDDLETRPAEPADIRCLPLTEGLVNFKTENGPQKVVLACGGIGATYGNGTGIFDQLREPVLESFANCDTGSNAFRALLDELVDPRVGSRALAETLMKQCLILVLRRIVQRDSMRPPWVAAMQDPRLAHAVEAILDHPEEPHRLQDLADMAGMSRASFSAHFISAFGKSPHDFLVDSRMRRAAKLLQTTNLPVKTIAAKVGYRSRSNFTRAFKAFYGTEPAGSRQQKAAE